MGWRDAQAKVNAGAYKPKADPFGEFATGFANVFVPTYTKQQEEKREEKRKQQEIEAKKSADSAAATAAENAKEKERQKATDYVALQLGYTDVSTVPEGIRSQIYQSVYHEGANGAIDYFRTRYPKGLPDLPTATPTPEVTQTEKVLSGSSDFGGHVTATLAETDTTVPTPAGSRSVTSDITTSTTPSVTEDSTEVPVDAQTINLFGPAPKEVDINSFIGQSSTDIADWIKFNKKDYEPEELVEIQEYLDVTKSREADSLWWKDPQKLDNMSDKGLKIALNGLDPASQEHQAITFALGIKTDGVKFDSLMDAGPNEFARFETVYGDQMKEEGSLDTFGELYELAKIKEKDDLWWRDPRNVDNLSDNGLQYAIESATSTGSAEEARALSLAQQSRTKDLNIDSLRGKSVLEFDQYLAQYEDSLIETGQLDTFNIMRSLQKTKESGVTSDKVISAKDVFLRSRINDEKYQTATLDEQGQMMMEFEKEWTQGTSTATSNTYTLANFNSDFIKYTEIVTSVGLGEGSNYTEKQIEDARHWLTVTKPIAEDRLQTDKQKQVEGLVAQGTERRLAELIANGGAEVRADAVTKQPVVFNLATGQPYVYENKVDLSNTPLVAPGDFSVPAGQDMVLLNSLPQKERAEMFAGMDQLQQELANIDVNAPMGISGAFLNTANKMAAFAGLGQFSPDTANARAAIDMLAILTETTLQAAFPDTRDSVYLKTRLRTLAPKYGVGVSSEDVLKSTNNMIAFLSDSLVTLEQIADGKIAVQPAEKSAAQLKLSEITKLKGYYEGLKTAFGEEQQQPSGKDYLGTTIPEPPAEQPSQATAQDIPIITSAEQRDALPTGTKYKAPNGQIYTKK